MQNNSVGIVQALNTAALLLRRILVGGVSIGNDTAQPAESAGKAIVDRLETIGPR